jgi:hypothetical protein
VSSGSIAERRTHLRSRTRIGQPGSTTVLNLGTAIGYSLSVQVVRWEVGATAARHAAPRLPVAAAVIRPIPSEATSVMFSIAG